MIGRSDLKDVNMDQSASMVANSKEASLSFVENGVTSLHSYPPPPPIPISSSSFSSSLSPQHPPLPPLLPPPLTPLPSPIPPHCHLLSSHGNANSRLESGVSAISFARSPLSSSSSTSSSSSVAAMAAAAAAAAGSKSSEYPKMDSEPKVRLSTNVSVCVPD